jgi:hypothetical protein
LAQNRILPFGKFGPLLLTFLVQFFHFSVEFLQHDVDIPLVFVEENAQLANLIFQKTVVVIGGLEFLIF